MVEVRLTVWGGSADSFNQSGNPVVAVKGCKVSDFSGVSLSALGSSVIQINPDLPKCHELKGNKIYICKKSISLLLVLSISF